MLSASTQPIARPRPPGHLRRSTNSANDAHDTKDLQSPPPPYEIPPDVLHRDASIHKRTLSLCSVSSNVDSSVVATAHMLGLELDTAADRDRTVDEEYIKNKSREDLEKLLFKAESVIRARERELSVAAAVGKQLLETNLSLRQRHMSLLTKSQSQTEPAQPAENVFSPPLSPLASPTLGHTRTPGSLHTRRLSASPAQLTALSTQNEELIQALARLQDETSSANLEGKQKLRKLEKEIAGLRAELDQSHQKNGELEEKINEVRTEHGRNSDVKKKGRELRHDSIQSNEGSNPEHVQNFAPFRTSTPQKGLKRRYSSNEDEHAPGSSGLPFPSSGSDNTPQHNSSFADQSAELKVLGQLLSKIEELESTNREILRQYRENDNKLRRATDESDALFKVYDNLEDEVSYADDEAGVFSADPSPLIASEVSRHNLEWDTKSDRLGVPHLPSTRSLRERGSPVSSVSPKSNDLAASQHRKPRKPLASNLFKELSNADSSSSHDAHSETETAGVKEEGDDDEDDVDEIKPIGVSRLRPRRSKARMAAKRLRPKMSLDASRATNSDVSPLQRGAFRSSASHGALSRVSSNRSRSVDDPPKRTLWSELQGELGEEWDMGDDDVISTGEIIRESDDTGGLAMSSLTTAIPEAGRLPENLAVAAIRNALDPRNNGKLLEPNEHILPVGSLGGSPGETFFLLSHAVLARPNIWVSGNANHQGLVQGTVSRVRHLALPPSISNQTQGSGSPDDPWEGMYPEESEAERDTQRVLRHRNSGHDGLRDHTTNQGSVRRAAAVARLGETARLRSNEIFSHEQYNEDEDDEKHSLEIRERSQTRQNTGGLGQTLLELWIILQAAIILVVFVYSMARRGPRAILDAAEVNKRRPR